MYKRIIVWASLLLLLPGAIFALPISRSEQNLLPFIDNTYYLGTTSPSNLRWKAIFLGTGTSTSAGGFDISAGCFAINGVCLGNTVLPAQDWVQINHYGVLTLTPSTTIPVYFPSKIYASSSIYQVASTTNQASPTYVGFTNAIQPYATTNGTYNVFATQASVIPTIDTGVTNFGSYTGANYNATRNSAADLGSLGAQRGFFAEVGLTGNVGSTAATTNVYGLLVNTHAGAGTIGSLYGVRVDPTTSGGTLNASYGLYLNPLIGVSTTTGILSNRGDNWFNYSQGNYKNVFYGNTGVGTSSPWTDFAVQGTSSALTLTSNGTATNTASQGWNIINGCYAINGTCLASYTDAQARAALSSTWPIAYNSGTGVFSWAGLATSSGLTAGRVVMSTGVDTIADIGTSTPTVTAPITYSGTLGNFLGGASGTFDCTSATSLVKGCLTNTDWTTFNNKVSTSRTLTVAGTANQISSSAGAQDLSADRTWTLSLPSHVIFPGSFFASTATITNATTTSLFSTFASVGTVNQGGSLTLGGSAATPPLVIEQTTIAGSATTSNQFINESTTNTFTGYIDGLAVRHNSTFFTISSDSPPALSAPSQEVTIVGTTTAMTGTSTIPANYLTAGKTLSIRAKGKFSTGTAAATLRIRVYVGTNVVCDTGANGPGNSLTDRGWDIDCDVTIRTTGAGGTMYAQGRANVSTSATAAQSIDMENTGTVAIDTTTTNYVRVTGLWSAALSAAYTLTATNATGEIKN